MVADRRPTDPLLRTAEGRLRIVPRHPTAVVAVIEVAEHLPITVVVAGRLHRAAEVAIAVEAEGDVPLLAAATVAIAN